MSRDTTVIPPSSSSATTNSATRKRRTNANPTTKTAAAKSTALNRRSEKEDTKSMNMAWTVRNQWVVYAVASGACAAFNGVFAKLTTNDLTTHIARGVSDLFGLEKAGRILEIAVRVLFFGLNLFFNGVMWTFFTQALAKGNSTTQVSIMNTSTNFMLTALLGVVIFAESLPPLWWAGASLLVAGNVVIGRRDEGEKSGGGDDANSNGGGDGEVDDGTNGHSSGEERRGYDTFADRV